MKTFEVSLSFQDRSSNTESSTVKIDASSIPGAIAKATREFVKKLDRKQRFDMNKNGLEIKAVHVASAEKESSKAESA
jgi:transcription initiation factor IIE alpha subunit